MDRSLIDDTLDRIDRAYQAGCLARLKQKRPKEWRRMITLEREINCATFQGDEMELTKVLNEYETFVLEMVKVFRTPKEETGGLFSSLQG